jgi:hypothetical protein
MRCVRVYPHVQCFGAFWMTASGLRVPCLPTRKFVPCARAPWVILAVEKEMPGGRVTLPPAQVGMGIESLMPNLEEGEAGQLTPGETGRLADRLYPAFRLRWPRE